MPESGGLCARVVDDRGAQLVQSEKRERTFSIVIEDAKIIGFVQVVEDNLKVATVTFFRDVHRQIIGKKTFDALCFQFLEQDRVGHRIVRCENDDWAASGE